MPVSRFPLAAVSFCCLALTAGVADAAESPSTLWTDTEAAAFCSALPVITETQLNTIVGDYAEVLRNLAPALVTNIRLLDYAAADVLFQKAINNNWGMLNTLTDTHFQPGGACTLLMTSDTLQQVDLSYNLHGLWMINAPLDNGGVLPMRYFLFGSGKVAIGYPDPAVIEVTDYDLAGGRYSYTRFTIADLIYTDDMRGMQNFQVLNAPDGKPGRFRGPKGSSLQSLRLDGGNIDIRYSLLGIGAGETIDNLEIEKR